MTRESPPPSSSRRLHRPDRRSGNYRISSRLWPGRWTAPFPRSGKTRHRPCRNGAKPPPRIFADTIVRHPSRSRRRRRTLRRRVGGMPPKGMLEYSRGSRERCAFVGRQLFEPLQFRWLRRNVIIDEAHCGLIRRGRTKTSFRLRLTMYK